MDGRRERRLPGDSFVIAEDRLAEFRPSLVNLCARMAERHRRHRRLRQRLDRIGALEASNGFRRN